jgi:hypothetical protein
MDDYTERAEQGLAYLDKHVPGWAKNVSVHTLEMSSLSNCVLGQLFPNKDHAFSLSVADLWVEANDHEATEQDYPYDWAVEHGFDNVGRDNHANRFWLDAIAARL